MVKVKVLRMECVSSVQTPVLNVEAVSVPYVIKDSNLTSMEHV